MPQQQHSAFQNQKFAHYIIAEDKKDTTEKLKNDEKIKKALPEEINCARIQNHEKAMKETRFLKLDRNSASPTESADGGKETAGTLRS